MIIHEDLSQEQIAASLELAAQGRLEYARNAPERSKVILEQEADCLLAAKQFTAKNNSVHNLTDGTSLDSENILSQQEIIDLILKSADFTEASAKIASHDLLDQLERQAQTMRNAASIAAGDPWTMSAMLPSRMWSDELVEKLGL